MQHPKRIIQAYFSRLLLLVHGFVAVWHTVWVTGNPLYWGLLTGVGILLGEGVFTLRSTKSGEWKWFSLMVFLYLCTAIPCIWVLELHSLDSTVLTSISPETTPAALQKPDLIRISITAEEAMWTSGVEQTMMLMLVVGRWLMPRGDLSRAQLYELLLVESALGADILDILDTSKQSQVETNRAIRVMGLGVFSWSMIQFPLVLTKIEDSDSYKYSKVPLRDNGKLQVLPKVRTWFRSCISSQVCTLLISLCMQDGPSLVYRLYLLIEKNMKNQMMIFFICQHILLIILQINRIIVYPDCDDEELKDLIELGKERKVKLCTRNNCQTLMSRLVFIFHGLLTVWFVVSMKGESLYWALSTGVLLLFVEALITLCSPYHLDLKWFSPTIILYLCTVLPCIWILELGAAEIEPSLRTAPQNSSHLPIRFGAVLLELQSFSLQMWTTGLEQTMLFALVLGRWLMPRGSMTRDQLSAVLMVDVGLGADILELFDPFKEPGVKLKKVVVVMGLVVFSWAFLQFPLVLTQKEFSVSTSSKKTMECLQWCCTSETLSLLVTLCMLDGPFLLYRISMLVLAKMRSQMMLYFVCKNFLTLVFVIYRLIMMVREKRKRVDAFTTANIPIDSDQQSEEIWTADAEQSLELGLWLLSDGSQTCSTRDLLGKEYQ